MSRAGSLRVYANDDVMVGTWLLGHQVDRARLVAKEYLDMWYQTSLSQCFPFCEPYSNPHPHPHPNPNPNPNPNLDLAVLPLL